MIRFARVDIQHGLVHIVGRVTASLEDFFSAVGVDDGITLCHDGSPKMVGRVLLPWASTLDMRVAEVVSLFLVGV